MSERDEQSAFDEWFDSPEAHEVATDDEREVARAAWHAAVEACAEVAGDTTVVFGFFEEPNRNDFASRNMMRLRDRIVANIKEEAGANPPKETP